MRKLVIAVAAICLPAAVAHGAEAPKFKKLHLTDQFYCEGASAGDFNRDGKMDIVSGPYWWEGPEFKTKHEIYPPKAFKPEEYSDNFLSFTYDLNGDGWTDYIWIGWPGKESYWFENPAGKGESWKKYLIHPVVENENPAWGDLTGDGKPELIFNTGGQLGYAGPDWSDPTKPWVFHPISPKGEYQRYTHGIGFGDLDGDGKPEFLEAKAWWERPATRGELWKKHDFVFATDAAQMLVYDVDGDGKNDVITCLHPHQYGLAWFRQVRDAQGKISFEKNLIMGTKPSDNPQGICFTQPHALSLADVNGDGLKDFFVGKRFWAHGPAGDPEPNAPAVLYWFELVRDPQKGARFVGHLIDDNSGGGLQVENADLNADGIPDVVVGNKKGTFVHLSQKGK